MKSSCKIVFFTLVIVLILVSCNDGSSGGNSTAEFDLSCDMGAIYTPFASPVVTTATGATTTVIALHGKNGSPTRSHMTALAADLNAQDYDVSLPYMPWHDFDWNGTLCDGMSYINSLIVGENNAGKSVILLGHSLAGPIVLGYTALTNSTKPDAVTVVAPGHFVHNSSVLADLHAASIKSAKDKVAAGQGDVIATFQTSNSGLVDINTTPNIYLSYHDTAQFPDIKASIPLVHKPTLWLAGLSDSLTNSANVLGIIDAIPKNSNYDYREIEGDHFTVVNNTTAELHPWYQGL